MERGTVRVGGGGARKSQFMSIRVCVCVCGSTADSQSLSPPLEAPSEVTVKAEEPARTLRGESPAPEIQLVVWLQIKQLRREKKKRKRLQMLK